MNVCEQTGTCSIDKTEGYQIEIELWSRFYLLIRKTIEQLTCIDNGKIFVYFPMRNDSNILFNDSLSNFGIKKDFLQPPERSKNYHVVSR